MVSGINREEMDGFSRVNLQRFTFSNSLSSLDVYSSSESSFDACCADGIGTSSRRMRRVGSWSRWFGSISVLRIGRDGKVSGRLVSRVITFVPSRDDMGNHESSMLLKTGAGKSCTLVLIT